MHNAVDKVLGHAVLHGIDLSFCIIGCTGRQPAAIAKKSANAAIPIVISRTAAPDEGITTAKTAGITLACFSRENRFTVYTTRNVCRVSDTPGADDQVTIQAS
jgi:FdhD protein